MPVVMDHGRAQDMESMDVGSEVPSLVYMARMYWVVVGAAIAFAAFINVLNKILASRRCVRPGVELPISFEWFPRRIPDTTAQQVPICCLKSIVL